VDAATVLLLAQLTGANSPPSASTDPSGYNTGNVTSATAFTKAWAMLPGTPVAGTVYEITTEFTGTWEGNALAFGVLVNSTWTQFSPAVGAPSFGSAATVAGWLRLTVRVQNAATARFALAGAIAETASSWTPGTGQVALAPLSQSLTVSAGATIALACLFGASSAGQGIASYGSALTVLS
jgi:hypothetical protein